VTSHLDSQYLAKKIAFLPGNVYRSISSKLFFSEVQVMPYWSRKPKLN
jgi:hypothetical protein